MSCFNFRLPPPKKAWKSFTNKLRSKLHYLHNPKPMKIHTSKHTSTTLTFTTKPYGAALPSSFLYKSKHRKSKQRGGGLARALPFKRKGSRRRLHHLNKSCAAPVFVDNLFKELPNINNAEVVITPHCGTSSGKSKVEVKASGEKDNGREAGDDDDMWESLGIASPLMTGIDERAEEFISSFRAEMQVQERIARSL